MHVTGAIFPESFSPALLITSVFSIIFLVYSTQQKTIWSTPITIHYELIRVSTSLTVPDNNSIEMTEILSTKLEFSKLQFDAFSFFKGSRPKVLIELGQFCPTRSS